MKNNPFVLPGFGQTGQMGQNPILASMEMMRQAWEGLASSGGMDAAAMGRIMSVEEMDKRIADLRAVENWLRMNLSMLSSTIQGLEVQRATVATLKSFVDTGMAAAGQATADGGSGAGEPARPRTASPLDEVLRSWPGQGGAAPQAGPAAPSTAQQPAGEPDGQRQEASPDDAATAASSGAQADSPDQSDIVSAAASAAQGWWNLLQQQFQTLAAATAASAEGALADLTEAGKAAGTPGAGAQTARKTPAKTASRTAAKKTAGKKTAARTAGQAPKAAKAAKAAKKGAAARKTAR